MRQVLKFANISVTSKRLELVDYLDIFIPSIFQNQIPRKTSRASYYFLDVGMGYLNEADQASLCIYGRFVKDTALTREQVLEDGVIVNSPGTLRTSPSFFFVINVADHRMVFMPETPFSPTVSSFAHSINYFFKKKYDSHIRAEQRKREEAGSRSTLKDVRESFPFPEISITPIAGRVEVSDFLKKFSKINKIQVSIVRRNQDLRPGELFDLIAEDISDLGPQSSQLTVNGGASGLDIQKTEAFIGSISQEGYEDTRVIGQDMLGARISGTNEDFSLTIPVSEVPQDILRRAQVLFDEYEKAKRARQFRVAPRDGLDFLARLREAKDRHG